jgi:hypothetical protein
VQPAPRVAQGRHVVDIDPKPQMRKFRQAIALFQESVISDQRAAPFRAPVTGH